MYTAVPTTISFVIVGMDMIMVVAVITISSIIGSTMVVIVAFGIRFALVSSSCGAVLLLISKERGPFPELGRLPESPAPCAVVRCVREQDETRVRGGGEVKWPTSRAEMSRHEGLFVVMSCASGRTWCQLVDIMGCVRM